MDYYWIEDSTKDVKIEETYEIGKEIGRSPFQIEGALSVVSACYDTVSAGTFAVNVIKKKVGYCPKRSKIAVFLKFDHENVMKVRKVFETISHINIVREYVNGKQLFQKLYDDGKYTESKVGYYMGQILSGLRYLHEHEIIHGNLKSENILVLQRQDNLVTVKICDHIQSTIMHYDLYRIAIIATPSICPPEILLSQIRTKAIDMWSVGIITFILLFGEEPFYRAQETELYRAIIHTTFSYPSDDSQPVTNASKDFINHLLLLKPEQRMNIIQTLQHPWLEISAMKQNQELDEVFTKFGECKINMETRLEEKVMFDIRRARDIFEKLVLRMPCKEY